MAGEVKTRWSRRGETCFCFRVFERNQTGVFEFRSGRVVSRFSLGLPVPAEEAADKLVPGEGELVTRKGGDLRCDRWVCDRPLRAAYGERAFELLSARFLSPEAQPLEALGEEKAVRWVTTRRRGNER